MRLRNLRRYGVFPGTCPGHHPTGRSRAVGPAVRRFARSAEPGRWTATAA